MQVNAFPVFIGFDSREPEAYEVAKHSILKYASVPVHIQQLNEHALRSIGLYRREYTMTDGQKIDAIDGRPFSTEFSFTRFLVPAICQWQGSALFMDCDQLFRTDIAKLISEIDQSYAVQVCRQVYEPKDTVKMDNQIQQKYSRKNWSSVMVFNNAHMATKQLTTDAVNMEPGSWLHQFNWCRDIDIGGLDHRWNWIDGTTEGEPLNVHYTMGGPWFEYMRWSNAPYFNEWREAAKEIGLWPYKIEQAA